MTLVDHVSFHWHRVKGGVIYISGMKLMCMGDGKVLDSFSFIHTPAAVPLLACIIVISVWATLPAAME